MRIIFVEDAPRVLQAVSASLTREGHRVTPAASCVEARRLLQDTDLDLAIVDIGLPDGSGLDLCRELRRDGYAMPILLLTAQTAVATRVEGLDAGADDFLAKPFAPAELHARLRALARRGRTYSAAVLRFGDLVVDCDRRSVTRTGVHVPLTTRELDIVLLLASRGGRVVLRDDILEAVWGDVSPGAASSLETLIGRIRRKVDSSGESCIRTHRQVGYAWQLEVSKHG